MSRLCASPGLDLFFKSKCKVTPRLDCIAFLDGATMFCSHKEQFTENTWIMSKMFKNTYVRKKTSIRKGINMKIFSLFTNNLPKN